MPGDRRWHDGVRRGQGAEGPPEGHLLRGRHALPGEEHDLVPQPQLPDGGDGRRVERFPQVDAVDLGADRPAEAADVEADVEIADVEVGSGRSDGGHADSSPGQLALAGARTDGTDRGRSAPESPSNPASRRRGMTPSPNHHPPPTCGCPDRMKWSKPTSWYSAMRSATSSWLPTRAVPAPLRTRPNPAHRLGATTRSSDRRRLAAWPPPWSADMRFWPVDSA